MYCLEIAWIEWRVPVTHTYANNWMICLHDYQQVYCSWLDQILWLIIVLLQFKIASHTFHSRSTANLVWFFFFFALNIGQIFPIIYITFHWYILRKTREKVSIHELHGDKNIFAKWTQNNNPKQASRLH